MKASGDMDSTAFAESRAKNVGEPPFALQICSNNPGQPESRTAWAKSLCQRVRFSVCVHAQILVSAPAAFSSRSAVFNEQNEKIKP